MAQTSTQKKAAANSRAKQKARGPSPGQVKKLKDLQEKNGQMQMALLNIRQMYDQSVMEKDALVSQLGERDQLVTAIAITAGGTVEVARTAIEDILGGLYQGYDVQQDEEGNFTIVAEEVGTDEGTIEGSQED